MSLNTAQRATVRALMQSLNGALNNVAQWASQVDQLQSASWTYSPQISGVPTQTLDAAGQANVLAQYATLKQAILDIVAQLP